MPLPDVVVTVKDAGTSRTLPSDTGTAYIVGATERGPIDGPRLCRSLQDVVDNFGARLVSSPVYDWAETYFAEGGTLLYVSRAIGAGSVAATRNLLDGAAAISLVVTAGQLGVPDPGAWGNSVSVQVIAGAVGGEVVLVITRSGVEVERSPSLADTTALIAWARANSRYIVLSQGASLLDPAIVAASALSTGADGAALADADWQAALDRIPADLGPGQICAPGRTTSAGHLQLLDHGQQRNRFALPDFPDTASDATLVASAQALYTAPNKGRRYGQPVAPWDVIPGLTAQTLRTVPPSARLAAQYARNDALGNPNIAAAGTGGGRGVARFVIDLSQPAWTDAQRKSLNEAGVTVSRRRYGSSIVTWGARTLADQTNDAGWSFAPGVRTVMSYVADARQIGDAHEFDTVDGKGVALGIFNGDLRAPAMALHTVGALFGDTPQDAFFVDTGAAINPPAKLAAGEMHGQVALRVSPIAERVLIDVVKVPITQSIA